MIRSKKANIEALPLNGRAPPEEMSCSNCSAGYGPFQACAQVPLLLGKNLQPLLSLRLSLVPLVLESDIQVAFAVFNPTWKSRTLQ